MPHADSDVLYEVEKGIAVITLNRPSRLNAYTPRMGEQLNDVWKKLSADPHVRAVVLTGAGRGFCAGADMDALEAADPDSEVSTEPLLEQLWCPKPVIAAVNGACAGIGFQLALMCDIRFAASGAKFTTAFARRGLIAEHGLAWLLPRVTSAATALDLLISARVFQAEEAKQLGVVHAVADNAAATLDRALAYARDLAANVSPTSMAVIKWQVMHHSDIPFLDAVRHSDELMVESMRRSDFAEGVESFVQRRPPRFAPLEEDTVPSSRGSFVYRGSGI